MIAEPTDHDLETTATEGETSEVPDSGDATEKEHLTTATKLQMLRETFGEEDWMRAQAGDQLHQLLGLEIKPGPDTSTIIADLMSRDIAKKGSVSSNHEESSTKVLQFTLIKESSVASQSKESPVVTTDISRPLEKSLSPEGGEGDVSKRLSEISNSFYSAYKRSSNTSTGGGGWTGRMRAMWGRREAAGSVWIGLYRGMIVELRGRNFICSSPESL